MVPRPFSVTGCYFGGAGTGLDDGAAGAELKGADGPTIEGAPDGTTGCTGIEIFRPSKTLELIRSVEKWARSSEVDANTNANVQVSLKSGLLAPPAPKTV